jgi:hypothetical protein
MSVVSPSEFWDANGCLESVVYDMAPSLADVPLEVFTESILPVPAPPRKPVIIYDFEDGASTDDEIDMDDRLPLPRGFGEVCASHGRGTHGWCVSIEPTYHDGNDKSREFAKTYLLALESHYGRDRMFIADKDIINHALGYSQSDVAKGHIEAFTYNNHSKRIFWHRKFDRGKLVDVNTPYAPKRVNYNRCFIRRSVASPVASPVVSHIVSHVVSQVASPVARNAGRNALRTPGPYDESNPKIPCCRGIVNGSPCTKVFCVNENTGKPYLSPNPEYFNQTQQLCKKCYELTRKDPGNEKVVVNGRKILMTRLR